MHTQHQYDVLVIGSGAAGLTLALRLSPRARVAVLASEVQTADDGYQIFQEFRLEGQSFHDLDEVFGGPLGWSIGAFALREDLDVEVDINFGENAALSGAPKRRK